MKAKIAELNQWKSMGVYREISDRGQCELSYDTKMWSGSDRRSTIQHFNQYDLQRQYNVKQTNI